MTRNLKALGLALVAVFALSAVGASAASAVQFHSASSETVLTGSQTTLNEFEIPVGTTECEKAEFEGKVAATTTSTVSVLPTYEECETSGLESFVNMNGCQYEFFGLAGSGPFTSSVNVVCPSGKDIKITIVEPGFCDITVSPQGPLGTVDFTNNAGKSDVTVNSTVAGIHASWSGTHCAAGTTTAGEYRGAVTVTGETSGGVPTNVWVE